MDTIKTLGKLRVADGQKRLIVNAPPELAKLWKGVPHDDRPVAKNKGYYDFVVVFAKRQVELEQLLRKIKGQGKFDCLFWACYPKGTGEIKSDIRRETVWKAFEIVALRTVTAVSIDDTWSALRGRPAELAPA